MLRLTLVAWIAFLGGCSNNNTSRQSREPIVFTNSLGMRFIYVPPGEFLMGHPELRKPVIRVRLSGYWIAETETTNSQYERMNNGRKRLPEDATDQMPVTGVFKEEVLEFAKWLSAREDRSYNLPTDARWEYAARAGREQKDYPWGDYYPNRRENLGSGVLKEVMSHRPSPNGLYDMVGNVREYVLENYFELTDLSEPVDHLHVDPVWPSIDITPMCRGGFYGNLLGWVWLVMPEVGNTIINPDRNRSLIGHVGFRLVLEDNAELERYRAGSASK